MKQFFEQYGAVALGILALLVLIAMITPVGNIIKTSLQGTVQTFSTSINAQVDDDLNAVAKIANGIGIDVPYPGNIVNYNGQKVFSSNYTDADVIWPARYDFGNSVTYYAEFYGVPGRSSFDIAGNFESAGGGFAYDSHGIAFMLFFEGDDWYTYLYTTDFSSDQINRLAGVYDGSTMKFYINGELKREIQETRNIKVSPYGVIVGNPGSPYDRDFTPKTNEYYRVGVFDGALTLEQIESLQYK